MQIPFFSCQNLTDANEMYQKKIDELQQGLNDAVMEMDRTREDYMKLKVIMQQHFHNFC